MKGMSKLINSASSLTINYSGVTVNEILQENNNKLTMKELIAILINKTTSEEEAHQTDSLKEASKKEVNHLLSEPLISVIIPTFDRKLMLKESIDSVLMQTYTNYEIIIIDDNSSDGTEQMIQNEYGKYKNVIYQKVLNSKDAGYNRNVGYNLSKGAYLVYLDDDDFYLDNSFFEKAIEKHLEYEDLSFVSGNALLYDTEKNEIQISNMNLKGLVQSSKYLEGFGNIYQKPKSTFSTVFKKEVLERAQFSNMLMMNDNSIYLRSLLEGQIYILNDIVGAYRVHNNNISKNVPIDFILKNQEEKLWVYKENIHNFENPDEWLFNQLMITFIYYIYESNPSYSEIKSILSWCFYKTENINLKLCFYILGNGIRNSLSRMKNKEKLHLTLIEPHKKTDLSD